MDPEPETLQEPTNDQAESEQESAKPSDDSKESTAESEAIRNAGRDVVEIHAQSVHFTSGGSDQESSQPYKDPTVELPNPSDKPVTFAKNDFRSWCDCLEQERILFLSSYDSGILRSAGYQISRAPQFPPSKRLLYFTDEDCAKVPLFSDLQERDIAEGAPSIIMVDVTARQNRNFLHSMPETGLDSFKDKMRRLRRYVLIVGNENLPLATSCHAKVHKKVDFLGPRLMTEYPDEADSYRKRIEKQRQAGLWPEADKDFCEEVVQAIALSLPEELARRDDPDFSSEVDINPLFESGNPIHEVVLFVATFFKKLPASDFHRLVTLLLGEKVRWERNPTVMRSEPGSSARDQTREGQRLAEMWEEDYRNILKTCRIELIQLAADGSAGISEPIVSFVDTRIREKIHNAFWSAYNITLILLFDKVYSSFLLFDNSLQVMEGATLLIVEVAACNPARYGCNFLFDLVWKFGKERTQISEDNLEDCVRQFFAVEKIYYRMAQLISEMLRKQQLRGTIKSFFTQLIEIGSYEEVCELIWRLRYEDGVDKFYWWIQIVQRGSSRAYQHVLKDLVRTAKEGNRQLAEVRQKAHLWLMGSISDRKTQLATHFLVEICLRATFRFRREPPSWPPENYILSAFVESTDDFEEDIVAGMRRDDRLNPLGKTWPYVKSYLRTHLLRADFAECIGDDSDPVREKIAEQWLKKLKEVRKVDRPLTESDCFPGLIQALITADWAMEILGSAERTPLPALSLFKRLVITIAEGFDRDTHRLLRVYWKMIADGFLEVNIGLRRAKCVTRDQRLRLVQAKKQVTRSRDAVLRLRNEVSACRK